MKIPNVTQQLLPVWILVITASYSCSNKQEAFEKELASLDLQRGDITLCSPDDEKFGSVSFNLPCDEKTQADFNLAMALLHSFEYTEAEKVFARVIDQDNHCVMAYWGVAMANFHALWAPPKPKDLEKGARVIAIARSLLKDKSSREAQYIEAIANIYDSRHPDYKSKLSAYVKASEAIYRNYPADDEAALFYVLALEASADPADKTFTNQKKAGAILEKMFAARPDHPGVAHYLIHNYDYPELAARGLPAARQYAAIATSSAHAQHMPSHIFTRLGLWDESIQSNMNSVTAARCYAESSDMKGHWDEELHGIDYLVYAYLQKGDDEKAFQQMNYLASMTDVFPVNFKDAYCFAAVPARYALERKDWAQASSITVPALAFPWEQFPWEKANIHFARAIGFARLKNVNAAAAELAELKAAHEKLVRANDPYKGNLVLIQIKAAEGWKKWAEGKAAEGITLLKEAADMEDATAKHPVTPGEVIPARELLADLLLEIRAYREALVQYEGDLRTHPNRFNGLYGAAVAAERSGDQAKAREYYQQLTKVNQGVSNKNNRDALTQAKTYLANKL